MPAGRPRKTCRDAVLEKALQTFWARGFDNTSMNDLAQETGMAKPGLYAAFGDKEALFGKVLEHYEARHSAPLLQRFSESEASLKQALEEFLTGIAAVSVRESGPGGCLQVNSVVGCTDSQPALRDVIARQAAHRHGVLADRFARAQRDGEVPIDADPDTLADFFGGQAAALAVMGRAGAERARLDRFISVALCALPAVSD